MEHKNINMICFVNFCKGGIILIKNICIDPTYYCNENCISCRCKDISKKFNNNKNLSKEDYFSIIQQFVQLGGNSLSIYGGEPLLSPFVFEIIKFAKNKGLKTSITTNGLLLLDLETCKKLIETDVDQIIISVMGVGEVYNIMHGGNYFNVFIEAIKQLINTDALIVNKLSFHMTIQRGNYNQLPEVVKLASKLGITNVSCQYVSLVDPEDNKSTENILNAQFDNAISHWDLNKNILINREQVETLINFCKMAEKLASNQNINLYVDPLIYSSNALNSLITGKYQPKGKCELCDIIILPDGSVGACAMLQHYIIGNTKKQSIYSIIQSNKYKELKKKVESGDFLPICFGCCRHAMFFEK